MINASISLTSREQEMPSFWLAALVGFVAGVAVTFGMLAAQANMK